MKITIVENNRFVTIVEEGEIDVFTAVDMLAKALIGVTYGPGSVLEGFRQYIEEHDHESS